MEHPQRAGGRRPDALSTGELARRLVELAGDERQVQVDFLLHLEAFDRRRAWLEAGFGSLWDYCREVLHLSEGAAGRRTNAMRVLRRFPRLEPALRDGRLSLSTVIVLGPVLTDENFDDLVARAAFLSRAETERLVVTLQPRVAPRQGVRFLPGGPRGAPELALVTPAAGSGGRTAGDGTGGAPQTLASLEDAARAVAASGGAATPSGGSARLPDAGASGGADPIQPPGAASRLPANRYDLRPVDGASYSLRVTLGARAKADLDALVDLLGHKTGRDLGAVVHEAIRCALEKHGKRRGVVAPSRARSSPSRRADAARSSDPRAIPVAVRRAVHARDGGRCTYVAPDGRRCDSRWKLELHHRDPAARGGPPTIDNLCLRCRPHNLLEAERDFGAAHVRRFTAREPPAREAVAEYGPGARRLAMGPAP